MENVFVVLCKYDGCEECSSGAHIVGVFTDEALATKVESEHEQERDAHLHSWICETVKIKIN